MSKRNNITYVKPQEPSFLAKLKAEIGYKEGPTVDTKRQKLDREEDDFDSGDERPDREDEKPQIVVLKSGDLTAEEVAVEQKRQAKEEAEKPADLSKPIVFKQRVKQNTTEESGIAKAKSSSDKNNKKKDQRKATSSSKLSFNEDEEDEIGSLTE